MKVIKIVFWYPSKLQEQIDDEIDFEEIKFWINHLNKLGLNVMIPSNVNEIKEIYVDEKMFKQR